MTSSTALRTAGSCAEPPLGRLDEDVLFDLLWIVVVEEALPLAD
jgi:hypothetical protein